MNKNTHKSSNKQTILSKKTFVAAETWSCQRRSHHTTEWIYKSIRYFTTSQL